MYNAQYSTTYLGPVSWYAKLLKYKHICPQTDVPYERQTLASRCYIDSPNGQLMLNIPIEHNSGQRIKDTRISYRDRWPEQHWQAIKTAYGKTPFFDAIGDDIQIILQQKPAFLLDLNNRLTRMILEWLRMDISVLESLSAEAETLSIPAPKEVLKEQLPSYPQAFDHKFGFRSNLSVIDLVFNEGPAAHDYLNSL